MGAQGVVDALSIKKLKAARHLLPENFCFLLLFIASATSGSGEYHGVRVIAAASYEKSRPFLEED